MTAICTQTNPVLHLSRNVIVRPSHESVGDLELSWGEGSGRQHFIFNSAEAVVALLNGPMSAPASTYVDRLRALAGISGEDADKIVSELREYALFQNESQELSAAEERWVNVAWHDALELHLATRRMTWLHDYTGNPKVMTKYFLNQNVQPDTDPPGHFPVPEGHVVALPPPSTIDSDFRAVQASRRTHRKFAGTTIDLAEISTILHWTISPQWPSEEPVHQATQTYSRGEPFVAFVAFEHGAPEDFARGVFYQFDWQRGELVRCPSNAPAPAEWSEILWTQNYADQAPMVMVLAVNWEHFMWKFRTSRAYRWVYSECGAFMQTALMVGTGLGLKTFQTPAIDDVAVSRMTGYPDQLLSPIYLAAFGRSQQ